MCKSNFPNFVSLSSYQWWKPANQRVRNWTDIVKTTIWLSSYLIYLFTLSCWIAKFFKKATFWLRTIPSCFQSCKHLPPTSLLLSFFLTFKSDCLPSLPPCSQLNCLPYSPCFQVPKLSPLPCHLISSFSSRPPPHLFVSNPTNRLTPWSNST